MEFTDYTVAADMISVTLPVFLGNEDACRMNRFYEAALKELYAYGCELTKSDRRTGFFCRPAVTEEDGILTVSLCLTCRRSGTPSVRKIVVHHWKDGYLIRTKKHRPKSRSAQK